MSKKTIIGILILILVAATSLYFFKQSTLQTFSSDEFSFKYPESYTISEELANVVTVVKTDVSKLEIFNMEDFGDRPFAFSGEEDPETAHLIAPTKTETKEINGVTYDIWSYYKEDDTQSQAELQKIIKSIK